MDKQLSQEKSGLATAGMVVGIIGICLSPLPIINNVAFILGALALIFGGVGIAQTGDGKKRGRGKAIAGVVLGILSVAIVIMTQQAFSQAIDKATESSSTQSAAPSSEEAPKWDMEAAYAKINNGMTKAQVAEAVGKQPDSCTENQSEYLGKTEVCTYGNVIVDKGAISVTFSQDKVSNKTKSTY